MLKGLGSESQGKDTDSNERAQSSETAHEKPQHRVTLSHFEIGRTEVTNAQYRRLRPGHTGADTLPATGINWHEAKSYCEAYGYALPTEAQWEYAARGGSLTSWSFGDDATQLGHYAWFVSNSGYQAQDVGKKRPNPLGLMDMHGNVWEWVADCYDNQAYDDRSPTIVDPQVSRGRCRSHVLRGGSVIDYPPHLRSAHRLEKAPTFRASNFGFRCVRHPSR